MHVSDSRKGSSILFFRAIAVLMIGVVSLAAADAQNGKLSKEKQAGIEQGMAS